MQAARIRFFADTLEPENIVPDVMETSFRHRLQRKVALVLMA
jgi:hypothetical protein